MSNRPLLLATATLLLLAAPPAPAQVGVLPRVFQEDRFQRLLVLDRSLPMFASDAEIAEAIEAGGKWDFKVSNAVKLDSNPFNSRTPDSDWAWGYGAGLGYQIWPESAVVITPSGSIGGKRLSSINELDRDILSAGVSVALAKMPLKPTLTYEGSWVYTSGFDDNVYREHRLGLEFGKSIPLGKKPAAAPATAPAAGKQVISGKQIAAGSTEAADEGPTFAWSLGGGYAWTEPSVLEHSYATATADLEIPITPQLSASLGASVAYRSYRQSQPADQETWEVGASAGVSYAITKQWILGVGVEYTHSDDKFEANDYDQVVSTLSLTWKPDLNPLLHRLIGIPRYVEEAGH